MNQKYCKKKAILIYEILLQLKNAFYYNVF